MAIGSWFATDLDEPASFADLPVEVTSGSQPAVAIVDQLVRGRGIVGRVTGGSGAVAVRIRPDGNPVRIAVSVHLDDIATRWWADRVRPDRGQAERPRLVVIRSQGRVRGATVLARRQGWLGAAGARDTIVFDLRADEVRDGLLVVELTGALTALPTWASSRLSANGRIGVRVDRIDVGPVEADAPPPAPVGTGDSALLVLSDGRAGQVGLLVHGVPPAPPPPRSPTNRWTRQRPARAVFRVLRAIRRAAGCAAATVLPTPWAADRLTGQAVDLQTGTAVPVSVEHLGRRRLDLRIDADSTGPVLVGLLDRRTLRAQRYGRQLACRSPQAGR